MLNLAPHWLFRMGAGSMHAERFPITGYNNSPTYSNYITYCLTVPFFKAEFILDHKKIHILVVNKKEMNKHLVDRKVFI